MAPGPEEEGFKEWSTMYERILVALDGSPPSEQALHEAVRLAQDQHAHLRLVSVVDLRSLYLGEMDGIDLDAILRTWRQAGQKVLDAGKLAARAVGIEPEVTLLESGTERISDVILEEAKRWPANLIVLGTHGRHGLGRLFLGSVAEGVARGAPIPVLLVKAG
jgi:nucleotide-binding universal stress UspA family protein